MKLWRKFFVFIAISSLAFAYLPYNASALTEQSSTSLSYISVDNLPAGITLDNLENGRIALEYNDLGYYDADLSFVFTTENIAELAQSLLSHRPGNTIAQSPATLGVVYFSLMPVLDRLETSDLNYTYGQGWIPLSDNLADNTESYNNLIDNYDPTTTFSSSSFYFEVTNFQYYDSIQKNWINLTGSGNGTTSISDQLLTALDLDDDTELVFGGNYRLNLRSNRSIFYQYKYQLSDGQTVTSTIKYNITFSTDNLERVVSEQTATQLNIIPAQVTEYTGDITFTVKGQLNQSSLGSVTSQNDYFTTITSSIESESLSDSDLERILNNAPGNSSSAASLGVYYYSVTPVVSGINTIGSYKNFSDIVPIATTDSTLLLNQYGTLISRLDDSISNSQYSLWFEHYRIQYYQNGTWNDVTARSNGGVTLGDHLRTLLETDTLIYGSNYRLTVSANTSYLVGWDYIENSQSYTRLLARVNQTADLDVYADITQSTTTGNRYVYYRSLEEALTGTEKVIYVAGNETLSNTSLLDQYVVVLKEGSSLYLPAGTAEQVINRINASQGSLYVGDTLYVKPDQPTEQPVNVDDATKEVLGDVEKISIVGQFSEPVEMSIKKVDVENLDSAVLETLNQQLLEKLNSANIMLFDLQALSLESGAVLQPLAGSKVQITLPIPAGYDLAKVTMIYIDDFGQIEILETVVNEDGTLSFVTDHFSYYAFAEMNLSAPVHPNDPVDNPTDPEVPANPVTPTDPVNSPDPSAPAGPNLDEAAIPDLGTASSLPYYVLLVAIGAVILIVLKITKRRFKTTL